MRFLLPLFLVSVAFAQDAPQTLTLAREANWLFIRGAHLPKGEIKINYLEAYCRAGSTDADWRTHTVVPHKTELVSLSPERQGHEAPLQRQRRSGGRSCHYRRQ